MSAPALKTKDQNRESLHWALFSSFLHHGYSQEESSRLAEIAIEPVAKSLELANYAYKLHLDAVSSSVGLAPIVISKDTL